MSKNLSLKLQEVVYKKTEHILRKVKRQRNNYINEAVHFYNKLIARRLLKNKLIRESNIVAVDSMAVLEEFERFEEGLPGEGNGH